MSPTELQKIAKEVGVGEFDLLLIGDGSGMTYDSPGGYFSWVYNKKTGEVSRVCGANSNSSNNFCELFPYIHALIVYDNSSEHSRFFSPRKQKLRVAVVSDSELTVKCAKKEYGRKANLPLWAAIDWFEENGFELKWFHTRRNTNPASSHADKIAGECRKRFAEQIGV